MPKGQSSSFRDGRRTKNKQQGISLHPTKTALWDVIAKLDETDNQAAPKSPDWPPPISRKESPMNITDSDSLMDASDRHNDLQDAIAHERTQQMTNAYNPEQPLNDFIPEAQAAVAAWEQAEIEYKAIKDEMDRIYKDRLEVARVKRDEAAAQMEGVKTRLKETAYEYWLTNPDTRKFWTVDKLITVQEKRQVNPDYNRAAVRAWVFRHMPALLEVKWEALENLVETMDKITPSRREKLVIPTPPAMQVETVNLVAVNLEKVAALGEVDTAALIDKATAGVMTQLMVKNGDSNAD